MLRPFHAGYPASLPRQEGLYALALTCRNLDRDRFQSLGLIPASRTAKSLGFSPWHEPLTAGTEALDLFPGWGDLGLSVWGIFNRCDLCRTKHLLDCLTSLLVVFQARAELLSPPGSSPWSKRIKAAALSAAPFCRARRNSPTRVVASAVTTL